MTGTQQTAIPALLEFPANVRPSDSTKIAKTSMSAKIVQFVMKMKVVLIYKATIFVSQKLSEKVSTKKGQQTQKIDIYKTVRNMVCTSVLRLVSYMLVLV